MNIIDLSAHFVPPFNIKVKVCEPGLSVLIGWVVVNTTVGSIAPTIW